MDNIQKAQNPKGCYGFKSEQVGNLSNENAVRLMKLKDYARELGLLIDTHQDGINICIRDSETFERIAKAICL
jgi:hypothetical protein